MLDRIAQLAQVLLWPDDPPVRFAISCVCAIALVSVAIIQLPLCVRLARLGRLRGQLDRILADSDPSLEDRREAMVRALKASPIGRVGRAFIQRWRFVEYSSDPDLMPARFADLVAEHPLLPRGPRASLLASLPFLLLAFAAVATVASSILAVSSDLPADVAALVRTPGSLNVVMLALHTSFWGILLATLASITGSLIEGQFDALSEDLDARVMRLYEILTARAAPLPAAASRPSEQGLVADSQVLMSAFEQALDRFEALAEISRGDESSADESSLDVHLEGIRQILEASNQFLRDGLERSEGSLAGIQTSIAELKRSLADATASAQHASNARAEELVERVEAAADRITRQAEGGAAYRDPGGNLPGTPRYEPARSKLEAPASPRGSDIESRRAAYSVEVEAPVPVADDADGTPGQSGLSGLLNRGARENTPAPREDGGDG